MLSFPPFVFIQQDFCFMRFCCVFIAGLVTFSGPNLIKWQNIKEKIELLGSNQLHIIVGDSRLMLRGKTWVFL